MKEWYDEEFFNLSKGAKVSAKRNARRIKGYRPKSVLDVGCGEGHLVQSTKKSLEITISNSLSLKGRVLASVITKSLGILLPA